MRNLYVFLFFFMLPMAYRASAQTPISGFYVANNAVRTIVQSGNTIYIGGDFTAVGPNLYYGSSLDATTGFGNPSFALPNGIVYAVVPDGSGGWYIGGNFTRVGNFTRNNIARINADGSVNTWDPNANGMVQTIAVVGSTVYAGGYFNAIGAQTRNYMAALDATTGLATAWDPNASAPVLALAINGSTLYAGG